MLRKPRFDAAPRSATRRIPHDQKDAIIPMPHSLPDDVRDRAQKTIELTQRWVDEAAEIEVDPAASRLSEVLKDPNGLAFTLGFVDGVMRPQSLSAAASTLHRIAPLVPNFLPWYLRSAVRIGGETAPVLPAPVVPIARRVLRDLVGHLVADARPHKIGPAIAKLRENGANLNLNLLGEAVLGEAEARRRLTAIHDLIRRSDVDYVSVKVSSTVSHISMWAFDEVVEKVATRLAPLYLTAAEDGTFINLDMEEYRDLDLTIAVFIRILEDPRLAGLEAGIVLQTYLPDSFAALQELTAWATNRVEHGGARIKIRLVKGANLAMEQLEATMRGWDQAPYRRKVNTDANYLRCLNAALTPEATKAVRIGVAGHNLFDIAYAWLLAGERDVRDTIEFEMLLGMAQAQQQAVSREVGPVRLYVPVVRPEEFDVAISYLVRRLEENASPENFLSSAYQLGDEPALFAREKKRFTEALESSFDPTLRQRPRRQQDRGAPVHESIARKFETPTVTEGGLTQVVLGIAADHDDAFLETAVYSAREERADAATQGAPGFVNTIDTDPALTSNREWGRSILSKINTSQLGASTLRGAHINDAEGIDHTIARVRTAAAAWGARPATERAELLMRAGVVLESRRAELIEVAASETGKILTEADTEVSEAVDFAKYYAIKAKELDTIAGATFVPSAVTVVAPPWNFPLAIAAGGVLAALAAGSGVVFTPAPQAGRCGAAIAEALWEAGIPRDVLALVELDEHALGEHLITHPDVDRVLLTGSWETAALFRSWRHDLPLHAETSGKNAIIIAPSADLELAAADLVRSAFSFAGQKCSTASLVILVGPVGRSKRFARQIADAARSIQVGSPSDPMSEMGPLIEKPHGKLAWALTELEGEEQWLVKPERRDEEGRLWSPGIRVGVQPGSRFHTEEFFGPVLGVMYAPSLVRAIELQNAVDFGLTAGLHTQNPDDLALWLDKVEAGNLYVNRATTGAIVQRQPFGGWKRSSVGPSAKTGGPNYLIGLGSWKATSRGAASSTLHLRGLDARITALIEAAQSSLSFDSFEWLRQAALSDAVAWDREFGRVRDVSQLGIERNLLRYRPVPVAVRATGDAAWHEVLRVVIAAIRAGAEFTLSTPIGLPAEVRRVLGDLETPVFVETDGEWVHRIAVRGDLEAEDGGANTARVRLVGPVASVAQLHRDLASAIEGDPDVAIYAGEVTSAGRIELLTYVHEQSISITAHRFGTPTAWSEDVI